MFHFSGIAHALLALNHETRFRAVTLNLPTTSPCMALGRDLLLAFLEPQYKLNKEDPSSLIPEILLTDKLKEMRQGDRSRSGISLQTWPNRHQRWRGHLQGRTPSVQLEGGEDEYLAEIWG